MPTTIGEDASKIVKSCATCLMVPDAKDMPTLMPLIIICYSQSGFIWNEHQVMRGALLQSL